VRHGRNGPSYSSLIRKGGGGVAIRFQVRASFLVLHIREYSAAGFCCYPPGSKKQRNKHKVSQTGCFFPQVKA
jgi:hypothetical protein